MGRFLLDSLIVVFLLLIGISVFAPLNKKEDSLSHIISEFEQDVSTGNIIKDGVIEEVDIGTRRQTNVVANLNSKFVNAVVGGANNLFELGINILRRIIG